MNGSRPAWPRLRRVATWAGVAVFVALFAELFLRIYAPVPMLPRYVSSAEYGVRMNTANQTYAHTTPDYQIVIRTNSKGIRSDVEIPYEKPSGKKRIVALGDSFLIGYGAHPEEMLLNIMIERLRSAGQDVELVNLAVSGFGNAEELVALEAEGMKYEPDLVLIGWHDTDLSDNVRSGLYRLREGKLERAADTFLPAVKTREFLFKIPLYRFLAGHSQLYNLFRDQAGGAVKEALAYVRDAKIAAAATQAGHDPTVAEIDAGAPAGAADETRHAELLMLSILQRLEEVSREGGAELAIIDIPVRVERDSFLSTFPAGPGFDDFAVFSPIPLFQAQAGELIYWERSHGHFTPLGNQIVGEGVADFILERRLLDAPKSP